RFATTSAMFLSSLVTRFGETLRDAPTVCQQFLQCSSVFLDGGSFLLRTAQRKQRRNYPRMLHLHTWESDSLSKGSPAKPPSRSATVNPLFSRSKRSSSGKN